MVPQPQPEYAKTLNDNAQAFIDGMTAMLASKFPNARETNERIAAFSDSFKTSKVCADCGEKLEAVYRVRRSFGLGLTGTRWTVGVLCQKCAGYSFGHRGPCKTCGREVFVSLSIPVRHTFCSTRCGQAHYRKAR